ncbi:MAG TPA: DMT family transporter [Mycobacteriales bacterium]
MAGSQISIAAILVGLAAGACFAVATVLQQRGAQATPDEHTMRPRLLVDLVRTPIWVAGILAAAGSFGLQALALALGPITLVQPLIVTDLLFALPLAARLSRTRLGRQEWIGAALVVAGLATFLTAAAPRAGAGQPGSGHWLIGIVVVAGVVVAGVLSAGSRPGVRRTSLLALAGGASFGLMSALTKSVTGLVEDRGLGMLAAWQPWAMAVAAIVGLVLAQSAFQAGPLSVALPLLDVIEPLVAVGIAVTVFGERISHSPTAYLVEAAGALAVVGGIAVLDRSRVVVASHEVADAPAPRPAQDLDDRVLVGAIGPAA